MGVGLFFQGVANTGFLYGMATKIYSRGVNSGEVSFSNSKLREKHFSTKTLLGPGRLWSRKSHHPTPTPTSGNFDYPTPTPTFSCISYLK